MGKRDSNENLNVVIQTQPNKFSCSKEKKKGRNGRRKKWTDQYIGGCGSCERKFAFKF